MLPEHVLSEIVESLVLLPLVGAVLVLTVSGLGLKAVRGVALITTLICFALSAQVAMNYNPYKRDANGHRMLIQMKTDMPWISSSSGPHLPGEPARPNQGPDIRFSLGVDGISLWLIALTGLLMIPAVLISWESIQDRAATYYALMLVLESGMMGVFSAQDIILFYIFFEFTLIPLFFMIGLWGGSDRRWAARKFFVFTLTGSLLTFLGLLFIVLSHSWMSQSLPGGSSQLTFSIPRLIKEIPQLVAAGDAQAQFWSQVSPWIFVALFAGFAIKVPLFPFHTWLPLAHVEAPTAGSVLLAGVLLKIGSYGFLRFMLPMLPDASWWAFNAIATLSVIGIIYGALVALAQDDIKKLVAYSSVSHMGFCLLGLFAFNSVGISGGMLQMINHGLSTGALFTLVGMLYDRYHTREIDAYSGMVRKFPILGFFFIVVVFSSIGLPGLNGFTGEILAMMGMFATNKVYGILSLSGIILGAWYMLQLNRRVMFGPLREPLASHGGHHHGAAHGHEAGGHHEAHGHGAHDHGGHDHHGHGSPAVVMSSIPDLSWRELGAIVPLTVAIFWVGLFPQFIISQMEPSIAEVVQALHQKPLPQMADRGAVQKTGLVQSQVPAERAGVLSSEVGK
ncbi:MAG: NADH-quinone oxidoreductase subunit M [Planctomycetales bacterium]